ncbi:MAG: ATP-dependent zinc metalloprotease FtsH, partial [Solirubrobacteraceae bacterium]
VSDGAGNDLAQVSVIARRMITALGMGDAVGSLSYATDNGNGYHYSDDTAQMIDVEVRRLVAEAEELARRVLREQRISLDIIAEALLEKETLTLEDVGALLGDPAPAARA